MRVVVAEDSVLLREGVVRLLEESGLEVVGQAGDAEDLLRKVGVHKPDVAVFDVRMPPTNTDDGLRAALEIRRKHPGTGVLVLSQYVEEGYALELVTDTAEGVGYLLRTASPTSSASSTPSAASVRAAPRSTPRWWPSSSGAAAARIRSGR